MIPYFSEHEIIPFPSVHRALSEPNGLLCAGGDLTPKRLMMAYRGGIFPWFSNEEPILWWSPDPRAIIDCEHIHISRSTRRIINKQTFEIRHNSAFKEVMYGCAAPRNTSTGDNNETWIVPEMIDAYCKLHDHGHAHSYECWHDEKLVGGIYGIKINGVFCGESMFSLMTNASKIAITHVAQCGEYHTIDCQIPNPHLSSLGAHCIKRDAFLKRLQY